MLYKYKFPGSFLIFFSKTVIYRNALGGKEVDVFDVSHIERGSCIDKEIGQTGVEIYGQAN